MITPDNSKVSLTPTGQAAVVEILNSVTTTQDADFSDVNMEDVLKELTDRGLIKIEPEPEFKGFGKKP